jgi:hypothetical protein
LMVIGYLEKMFARSKPWRSPVWKYLKSIGRLRCKARGKPYKGYEVSSHKNNSE